jgi:NAD(P)-dependent dehydrogenase (short-subunit alcohol dehydrogenase family)
MPVTFRVLASEPLADNLHRTDEPAFTAAIQSVVAKHGHLDGLILNAGTMEPLTRVASADTPLDAWRTHFEVNVYSLIAALKAAVPPLRDSPKGGRVVFVSSGAAVGGTTGWGPYNASKAAMNSLNRLDYHGGLVDTSAYTLYQDTGWGRERQNCLHRSSPW